MPSVRERERERERERLLGQRVYGIVMSAIKTGTVYGDHAGATLHSDSQLRGALDDLSANLYSNPRIQPFLSFPHLIVHCLRGLKQPKSCELGNPKGGYGR
jgi:hypothetical protein